MECGWLVFSVRRCISLLEKDYDGSIGIKVVLKRNDKVILEKHYSAKKSGGTNFAMTGKAFAKTLEITLQETLKQAVNDINKELSKQ